MVSLFRGKGFIKKVRVIDSWKNEGGVSKKGTKSDGWSGQLY